MIESVYDVPCKDCEERTGHCHTECSRYKEWWILNEKKKADLKKQRDYEGTIRSPAYDRMHLNALRKKREGRR
jgi:hypothetical protein